MGPGIRRFAFLLFILLIFLGAFRLASTDFNSGEEYTPLGDLEGDFVSLEMTEEVAVANTLAELRALEPAIEVSRTIAIRMPREEWDSLNESGGSASHMMEPDYHVALLWVVLFKTASRLEQSNFIGPSPFGVEDSSPEALASYDFWYAHEDGTRMGFVVWDPTTSEMIVQGQQGQRGPHDLWQAALDYPGAAHEVH